jgi:spore maturation protein CgeB
MQPTSGDALRYAHRWREMEGIRMRIGVIGPVGREEFAENAADALRRMGHAVTQLGPAQPSHRHRFIHNIAGLAWQAMSQLDERAQRRISRAAADAECEVIVNIDLRLMPETVKHLKSGGARVVFWFPDTVSHLARQLMVLAPYDALFFKEPHIVELLQANLGLPVYYLPEACNPRWHRPVGPAGTEPYLVVAGTMYPVRVRLLERLMAKGIPLKLYGVGIPRWVGETTLRTALVGRYISHEEKARVFRSSAGVLNTMHPGEVAGVNGRLFQAAGCGAAVLSEFRPKLPEVFALDEEVLAFRDFGELVDQATRLLNEAGLTARLGDAAARRAHRDHTYDARLATILKEVS